MKKQTMDDAARRMLDLVCINNGTNKTDIGSLLGIPYRTFYRRYKDPNTMTLDELRRVIKKAKPSDEEILRVLKG